MCEPDQPDRCYLTTGPTVLILMASDEQMSSVRRLTGMR